MINHIPKYSDMTFFHDEHMKMMVNRADFGLPHFQTNPSLTFSCYALQLQINMTQAS